MRKFWIVFSSIALMPGSIAIAGPLEGLEKNIDRNRAMTIETSPDGNDYASTDDYGVTLGSDIIGVKNGQGGVHANDQSVVSPWRSLGCNGGTRIDLDRSGGAC
ncbi:hypothetical protein O2N63_07425 [Aliiroseovarius sp. KMU-50]|uniref:Uncharacterized protein n=1 Tax=Aliiroseovarius salicola TaxID=3009082 RepID=A0ABT4W077_9RHOB|nr:hypothetical protein [Aliiroseovarius sp. KMU-50]MDA5093915.1 hypothetical protein [Aliiroseovarius sp. KMU-50]